MSFDTQVTQLESSQLESLFEAVPSTTPNANDLKGAREDSPVALTNPAIPFLDDIDGLEEKVEDKIEDKVEEPKTEEEKAKAEEDKVKAEKEAADKLEADEKAKKEAENLPAINEVLKNTVEYLVSSGQWADFDGREDLEVTQEVYAELVAKQDEHRVTQMFSELLDSTGDYGKAIISHIKKGGNPDEIIDLFKEQKSLDTIDTSKETGKQALIEKYYSEILGWKTEKVQKTVKRLIEDNEIDTEFTDVKEMYDKHYEEKLEAIQREAAEEEKALKQKEVTFKNNIRTALEDDSTLSKRDKALIASSILDFKHQLDNGQKVNDFYLKFAEMQADPKEYIKLVRFVMNPKGFMEQIQKKEESKADAKAFNFIKGNVALSKTKGANVEINEGQGKTSKGTDFSFAIKNK